MCCDLLLPGSVVLVGAIALSRTPPRLTRASSQVTWTLETRPRDLWLIPVVKELSNVALRRKWKQSKVTLHIAHDQGDQVSSECSRYALVRIR